MYLEEIERTVRCCPNCNKSVKEYELILHHGIVDSLGFDVTEKECPHCNVIISELTLKNVKQSHWVVDSICEDVQVN